MRFFDKNVFNSFSHNQYGARINNNTDSEPVNRRRPIVGNHNSANSVNSTNGASTRSTAAHIGNGPAYPIPSGATVNTPTTTRHTSPSESRASRRSLPQTPPTNTTTNGTNKIPQRVSSSNSSLPQTPRSTESPLAKKQNNTSNYNSSDTADKTAKYSPVNRHNSLPRSTGNRSNSNSSSPSPTKSPSTRMFSRKINKREHS